MHSSDQTPVFKISISLILGLISFAFAPILVRFAGNIQPLALAAWRTVFAALILLPFWITKRLKRGRKVKFGRKSMFAGILAGLCLGVHFTFWIASLHFTTVASASVLVSIHPIILIVAESLLFNEHFSKWSWSGVFVAFAGSALLAYADKSVTSGLEHPVYGDLMAIIAAIVFSVYFLIGRKLRQKYDWLDYVFLVYSWAAISCLVLSMLFHIDLRTNGTTLLMALGMAIGPQIMGHGSMNFSVKYISPTLLSTLVLAEPILATLLAFWIFGELPSAFSFTAMTVVICGISLTWRKEFEVPKVIKSA